MKKALMIIAIVVLVIVLGGIGIFYYYTGRLQQNNAVEIVEKPVETPQQLVLGTLDPSSITPSPTPEPTPTAHPIYAVDTINENIINILLVGIDTRDTTLDSGLQHGDVQMILSINKDDGSVKLTSLLRDLYVTIPGYKNKNRINVAYARGGGQLAMRTVNKNFELNIESYVTINFYGLASIIDAIGGVDVDMTKQEAGAINTYLKKHPPKYDNTDGKERQPLERVAGVQHLDGVQAVMYARLRSIDNDFARTARQRHLLELLLGQIMQDMTLDKLIGLIETCVPYVTTNVNLNTMLELGMTVLGSGIIQRAQQGESLIGQHRVPMDKTYSYKDVNGASVVYMGSTNFPKNVQALHEFIYGAYYPAD